MTPGESECCRDKVGMWNSSTKSPTEPGPTGATAAMQFATTAPDSARTALMVQPTRGRLLSEVSPRIKALHQPSLENVALK